MYQEIRKICGVFISMILFLSLTEGITVSHTGKDASLKNIIVSYQFSAYTLIWVLSATSLYITAYISDKPAKLKRVYNKSYTIKPKEPIQQYVTAPKEPIQQVIIPRADNLYESDSEMEREAKDSDESD
jgi:hypothetical protein